MSQVIAFTSGSGGSGKTTITAQIGKSLARLGKKTLVMELTSNYGFIDYIYQIENKIVYNLNDILEDNCTISNAIINHNELENLYLIPSSQSALDDYNEDKLIDLISYLKSNYDYILLDMDNNNNKNIKIISTISTLAVLITTCDITSIRACNILGDIFYKNNNINCKLIVNKIEREILMSNAIKDIDDIIDSVGFSLIGAIPFNLSITDDFISTNNILTQKIFASIAMRIDGKEAPLILKNL